MFVLAWIRVGAWALLPPSTRQANVGHERTVGTFAAESDFEGHWAFGEPPAKLAYLRRVLRFHQIKLGAHPHAATTYSNNIPA